METKRENIKIEELSDADKSLLKNLTKNYKDHIVQVGPKKYKTSRSYPKYFDHIQNFGINKDDIWIVTLPRAGTTLTQELVWQVCNNCDFNKSFKIPLVERFPFFEFPFFGGESRAVKLLEENKNNPELCARIKKVFALPWEVTYDSPRFFKTHLPLSLLPRDLLTSGCKIVYVARNPKDNIISRFHKTHSSETFEDFWTLCENNLLVHLPFFAHMQEAWDKRHSENLLFLFYENIVNDLEGAIKEVAKFLSKDLTKDQINQLVEHLKIDNFKKNDSVSRDYADFFPHEHGENLHVRKGKVGSWKEECFTEELSKRADKWIEEQYKSTDLRFPEI